jgi:hypothetical protein
MTTRWSSPHRVAAYDPGKNGKLLVNWSTTYDLVGGGGLIGLAAKKLVARQFASLAGKPNLLALSHTLL